MKTRRAWHMALVIAILGFPFAAFAQPQMGSVTTAPANGAMGAPALAGPMLVVAAMILMGIAALRIRKASAATTAAVLLAAGLSLTAGIGFATGSVVVDAGECNQTTVHPYPNGSPIQLSNSCPNDIRIVEIDANCEQMQPLCATEEQSLAECSEGMVLANGEACYLPICDYC